MSNKEELSNLVNANPDNIEENNISEPSKSKCVVYVFTLVTTIGGFLFGYDTGVVSGAILLISEELKLNEIEMEVIVSSTIFSAFVASICGSYLNEYKGRHFSIMMSSILFSIGSLVLAFSQNFIELIIGRIIVGLGVGLSSLTVPIYISEAAPPELRGFLVTLNTLFVTGGQFIASLVDGIFSNTNNGWRYMLGIAFIPAFLQLILFYFYLPKSPRWLLLKEREEEAINALMFIRNEKEKEKIENELEEIKNSLPKNDIPHNKIFDFLKSPSLRSALLLGCILQFAQQTAGINNIMYYSPMIIKMSGFTKSSDAIWLSCFVSFSNFIFTPVGMYLVDRKGRRLLTLFSLGLVIIVIFLMGGSFLLDEIFSYPLTIIGNTTDTCSLYNKCSKCISDSMCGVCKSGKTTYCISGNETDPFYNYNSTILECNINGGYDYTTCPSYLGWPILILLILFLACFAPGMGSMPWAINSEIFPLEYRSVGMAITSSVNWVTNFAVSATFLSLINALKGYGAFFLYGGISVLNFVYLYCYLVETKGLTLEEIHRLFERKGSKYEVLETSQE